MNETDVLSKDSQMIAEQWRKLAYQFDNHRMQAIWHLKAIVDHLPIEMQKDVVNL